MRSERHLRQLLIAAVAAGLLLGVVLNRLLPHRVRTAYSFAPVFSGCRPDDGGNGCNCARPLLPSGTHRDTAVRAGELLAGYSSSLCQLADAVDQFRTAPVENRDQLQRAARTLFAPIRKVNDTARELQWSRLPLTLDLLSGSGLGQPAAEQIACSLKSANKFQVETFRNNLNALMVNIVAAYQGNGDESTFENIRRQQASEWPTLALKLRRGCEQYRR